MNEVRILPYSIDFDGVLAESIYPEPGIGPVITKNLVKLHQVAEAGHEIAVHTARAWSDYSQLERWLAEHEIPFNAIICGKFLAERYVDDRAINSNEEGWL